MKAILAITAAVLLATVNALFSDGQCTPYTAQPNFDKNKYLGKWYLIQGDYGNPGAFGSACSSAQYTLKDNGDIKITNSGNYFWLFGAYLFLGGDARCPNSDGRCTVSFYGNALTDKERYNILMTDYTSYSLVYNCEDLADDRKEEIFWIISRNPTMDDATLATLKARITEVTPGYDQDKNLSKQY